ncbi:MAG: hypothetical protein R3B90_13985 [Planctomycetaceae bacterium]
MSAFGLAVWCLALIPWCLFSAAIGRMWRVQRPVNLFTWCVGFLAIVSLTQWAVLVYIDR